MKNYELVCIFDPQVGEGQFEQAVERYQKHIAENGGEVVHTDLWGLRRLAYTSPSLKNRRQGYYVLYQFRAEPAALQPLEQVMRLDNELLRHLITAVKGDFIRVPQLVPEDYLKEQLAPPRRERGRPGERGGRRDNREERSRERAEAAKPADKPAEAEKPPAEKGGGGDAGESAGE